MLQYILIIIIILCLIHICFNYNEKARMMNVIPGPRNDFILGNALSIMKSPVQLMKTGREFARKWNGIYRIYVYPIAAVNIFNPDDVEVIVSNIKHHEKGALYSLLKPWLGDGLLISKGSKWQKRRKILTPTFHFNILRQFFEIFEENANRLVQNLLEDVGKPINIVPILEELTLNSICETAMGTKLDDETSSDGKSYKEALLDLIKLVVLRGSNIFLYSDLSFYLSPLGRRQAKRLKTIHNFTQNVIAERTEYIKKYGVNYGEVCDQDDITFRAKTRKVAMLDLLITAEQEGSMDKKGIQEEVDTFMFEGHDTTASGLIFCFMIIANHLSVQDKIFTEIKEILGDPKRAITVEDLTKMKYLECCIKESLRLYPPVHFMSRNLNEPVQLSNYEIPAGVSCHIHIYDLHRRADLFENPNDFIPERFFPENSIGRHPYAYIPFSAGPRNCIGQKFAMMEMKLVLASVLREFELLPVTRPTDIEYTADLILRNNGPVEVHFLKRL